jgi:GSCFA family
MDFQVPIDIRPLPAPISYRDRILLIGSCFTEHIGHNLEELKFQIFQNPNGILFDPASVAGSLVSYVRNSKYSADDLFQLNEVWNSWQHHSRFSHINREECVAGINDSQAMAHEFLKKADWLVITLGSAFSYRLTEAADGPQGLGVANCHRAPAQWFQKHLLTVDEILSMLDQCMHRLFHFNQNLRILFTISPVRHIRDGVIDNNRSKARLIESVHHMVNKFDRMYYFPAYEIVIDVLRDYRFYDIDLVHPNYMATQFVMEKFAETCILKESRELMEEVRKIVTARKHRPMQPGTSAHKSFLRSNREKAKVLLEKFPFLDLANELAYFSEG